LSPREGGVSRLRAMFGINDIWSQRLTFGYQAISTAAAVWTDVLDPEIKKLSGIKKTNWGTSHMSFHKNQSICYDFLTPILLLHIVSQHNNYQKKKKHKCK